MTADPLRAPGTDDDEPWAVPGPDPEPGHLLRNVLAVVAVVLIMVARRRA